MITTLITNNNIDPFIEGPYFGKLKELCDTAKLKMINTIVDISKHDFNQLSLDHEFSMFDFEIRSDQYDTSKWWDGHKLVNIPKSFIGLCRRLKTIIEIQTRDFIFIKNAKFSCTPSNASSQQTLTSINEYTESNDAFSLTDIKPPPFDFVLTTSLKVQIVTYLISGIMPFGMCCQCKQPVYFKYNEEADNQKFKAECNCPMFKIYMCPVKDMPQSVTIKELTELVGDLIAFFAYDDCIVCVPPDLESCVQGNPKRKKQKTNGVINQFLFVDSSFEFNNTPDKILCQLVMHRCSF